MWKIKDIVRGKYFWRKSLVMPGALLFIATTLLTFIELVENQKVYILIGLVCTSILYVLFKLIKSLRLKKITLNIDGSEIEKKGDIWNVNTKLNKYLKVFQLIFHRC